MIAPLKILVVEDDPDTRANLGDILELDAHTAIMAGTAAEALGCNHCSDLSVIILDRRLPDGRAEDLIEHFRELAPQAAVIVVTGYADVEGAISALRRGAADYILKPINPDALRASINRIAEAKRTEVELRNRAEQQSVVAEIGQQALQATEPGVLMEKIVRRTAETLKVEFGRVLELLPGSHALQIQAGYGWNLEQARGVQIPNTPDTHAGYALHNGTAAVSEDLCRETRFAEAQQMCAAGFRSGVCVVIHGAGRPYGTLGVHSRHPRSFSQADVDFLQAIANVLAATIERTRTERRVLQAERLAAIGQVVTGLAHESRNALQRSQACLEMLGLELHDRPQCQELVARIQRAQDHLHHLYEEVRNYAAPITLKRARVDVRKLWRDTWSNLELAWKGKGIELQERVLTDDLECRVDQYAIEQVFRNILENAISATERPAPIVITAAPDQIDDAPALQISIRDYGSGMSAEQQSRIFEPFYTTKTQGTGLGMAITRRIIDAHNGRIRLGQPDGPGAELIVSLPRTERAAAGA